MIRNSTKKLKLGKKTDYGYEYSSKVNFKEDLEKQIANLMKEKKAYDMLEEELEKLKRKVGELTNDQKEKNVQYYYKMGKCLLFLEKKVFKDISPYSIYRRIAEEIPQILPHIEDKELIQKHLEVMYRLAHLDESFLNRISWNQWYELMKFKYLLQNRRELEKTLNLIKGMRISGKRLRSLIKEQLEKS